VELKTAVQSRWLLIGWLAFVGSILCLYFFYPALLASRMQSIASVSVLGASVIYLFLGCIRGFTLVPATYLIVLGTIFLNTIPLFVLTMVGTVASSAGIYYFSSSFQLLRRMGQKHQNHIHAIESRLQGHELPVINGWSFMPILPTDLICYVSGVLRLKIVKVLLGVIIGEGLCSAMYIFAGSRVVLLLRSGI
jgi:uncharacterized membrane protein YdjX (TVP38/TMEM64 family)